ncbi:hypothetical protein [Dictyobacter arantiisoli]|uniref:Uncharacterized protein n=1 Tax=Dictyobacter arantiisoli TaxID=2014874 RepID=A0A5A5T5V9_9CHLR|nr:hypothetical protein [Dictyobacter arantiisoli]GCF06762.1 hypothetical protein KDI_03260 [Dictyobacter arantiisoli]
MELWTNSDEQDQSLTGAAEGSHPLALHGTRRPTNRAILSWLRGWLLQSYVAPYCHSLGDSRIFRRCYWIDALGGYDARSLRLPAATTATRKEERQASSRNGKRVAKKEIVPVAPALQPVVTLAQQLVRENQPVTLYGLLLSNGSSKSSKRSARRQQAEEAGILLPKESGIVATGWREGAAAILKEIEPAPAILLLDPLTMSNEQLAPLYQRTVPTELLFCLSHHQISIQLQAATKLPEQATALTSLLRSDRWKSLPTEGGEVVKGFLELLTASMQRHYQWTPQHIALSIPNGPASTIPIPYTLIFASRRQDSLLIMNDALCLYQRQTYQQSYSGVLGEEWFAHQAQQRLEEDLNQLPRHIQQQGIVSRIRRWPDLRQQLILKEFGHFTRQEYDQSIQQLIVQQEVRCTWRQTSTHTEAAGPRIPDNGDTLHWR